jgi:hypothetical protein
MKDEVQVFKMPKLQLRDEFRLFWHFYMKKEVITGGCLCGAIRYQGRGEPYNVTHCHCLDCRKAAGAAFVTWASFGRNEFRFVQGEPRTIEWDGRLRSFCPNCGTALTFMSGPETNEVDVTVASFDEPEPVTPKDHAWVSDRIAWTGSLNSLPMHEKQRTAKKKA